VAPDFPARRNDYALVVDDVGTALTAIATFDGMPYDVTLVSGSITVAAIPEPGSFALVGLVTLLASAAAVIHKRSGNAEQREAREACRLQA
jgi:hypothetical protein